MLPPAVLSSQPSVSPVVVVVVVSGQPAVPEPHESVSPTVGSVQPVAPEPELQSSVVSVVGWVQPAVESPHESVVVVVVESSPQPAVPHGSSVALVVVVVIDSPQPAVPDPQASVVVGSTQPAVDSPQPSLVVESEIGPGPVEVDESDSPPLLLQAVRPVDNASVSTSERLRRILAK